MKFIHAKMTLIHVKSFVYGHINPCRWIKITLSFKFRTQSFKLRLYIHAQAILKICPSHKFIHKSSKQSSFKNILYMLYFFCCHDLLSQEQHSINVLLSISCPTSTKDKIQYILYPLLSCLAPTRTTFNICLVLVILSCIHKNEIQYMFYFLFSCLTSTITTLHMFCILLSWFASTQTTLCVQWQDHVSTTLATFYKNHKFVPHINV
jgi:hypothetical protein